LLCCTLALGQDVSLQRHECQHLDQEQGGDQRLDQTVQDGTPEAIASGLAQARAGSTPWTAAGINERQEALQRLAVGETQTDIA
jgi:hypothetical protein